MRTPLGKSGIVSGMNTRRVRGDYARFMTTPRVHNHAPARAGNIVEADVIFAAVEVVTLFDNFHFLQGAMGACDQTLIIF